MPTLLLLTIEVRAKAAREIKLVEMKQTIDPLAPKLITLGENDAITTKIVILAAAVERVKTIQTLTNPNSLTPSVASLIISCTTT